MSHSALTLPWDSRSASRSLLSWHLTTDKLSLFDIFDQRGLHTITVNLQVLVLRMQPSLHTSSHVFPYCRFLKMFLKRFKGWYQIGCFHTGDTNRPVKKLACQKLTCYFWPVIQVWRQIFRFSDSVNWPIKISTFIAGGNCIKETDLGFKNLLIHFCGYRKFKGDSVPFTYLHLSTIGSIKKTRTPDVW